MEVWGSGTGLVRKKVYIDAIGVDIEEFEHDPKWFDEVLNDFSLNWSDWDEIVAAVEAHRQEVQG